MWKLLLQVIRLTNVTGEHRQFGAKRRRIEHKWNRCLLLVLLTGSAQLAASPNILVILTDDQRFDTLWAMPIVQSRLVANGVNFTNAYVSTPQCCPARSGFLSGGFLAQNTGVLTVNPPNGGWENFNHDNNLATQLAPAGYSSAMIGKYFARFNGEVRPAGWALFDPLETKDTAALTTIATTFLDNHDTESPFLLFFSTGAPHIPPNPAVQDQNLFLDYLYRGRGFGEEDISDKPGFVQSKQSLWDKDYFTSQAEEDEFHRDQLRALQGVDRAVGEILDKLETMDQLTNTVIVFTSDHGLMWGEHGLFGKNKPYEESLRVPLVVVAPGIESRTEEKLVVTNTDIGATIHDIAGVSHPTDGISLMPLLADTSATWRTQFLIEEYRSGQYNVAWPNLPWAGVIQKTATGYFKYVEYAGGANELYDLGIDPYELNSLHDKASHNAKKDELLSLLDQQRGLAITFSRWPYPEPVVNEPFTFNLTAWGGDGNYTWTIAEDALPPGITLDSSASKLSGTPTTSGTFRVVIQVEDTAIVAHTGNPQTAVQEFFFEVISYDTDGDGLNDDIELQIGTDTLLEDSDGDGLSDGFEVAFDGVEGVYTPGSDLNPLAADTDNDGMTDDFEVAHGLSPLDPNDAALDADRDGISNLVEFNSGTNPRIGGAGDLPKPNILFFFVDDMGWGDSRFSNPDSKIVMPNLEQLANEGMVFSDAHTSAAVCAPSRYSALTGNYQWRGTNSWGVWTYSAVSQIKPDQLTVGNVLQNAGYKTAFFGKMHLGGDFYQTGSDEITRNESEIDFSRRFRNGLLDHGFDYTYALPSGIQEGPYAFFENDKLDGNPANMSLWLPGFYGESQIQKEGLGMSYWDSTVVGPRLTLKALNFINQHHQANLDNQTNTPFFMYYASQAAHAPRTPPESFLGTPVRGVTSMTKSTDMIYEMDVALGILQGRLEELGLLDNTLIIFTSDNGGERAWETNYNHDSMAGLRGQKGEIWEGGHRVPFVAKWGDGTEGGSLIAPGSTSEQLIGVHDLLATLAALSNQSLDEDQANDSVNFLPVLLGQQPENEPVRDHLIMESRRDFANNDWNGMPRFALRNGSWKLIVDGDHNPVELYDLNVDLYETNNLINDPNQQGRVNEMQTQFSALRSAPRTAPVLASDSDGDGLQDPIDNCPLIPNPDQLNTNGGPRGDACVNLPPGC